MSKHVVIMVPGIMGSVLKLGDAVIWPGPILSLVKRYGLMDELLSDGLEAVDCIRSYAISDQYNRLIEDLESCGFHEDDGTLVIAAYDWRKDNAVSAGVLAEHIDRAVVRHGAGVAVSLVAHSMGGLVSRYYLESGGFRQRPGFARVARLITLGTPHLGAALALPIVLGYEKRLFLNKEQVHQLCRDPRYPSAYQLLPRRGEPFAIDGSGNAGLAPRDIYDPAIANQLGLSAAGLAAASRLHAAMNIAARPAQVRYFAFAGTRHTTATYVRLQRSATGLLAAKMEQKDGGDGTVPTWSSQLPGIERMFVGEEHASIYRDGGLRRALATLLGKEGVLEGIPANVSFSLRDKVVEPSDLVHAVVAFPTGIEDFDGVITVERAQLDDDTGRVTGFGPPVQTHVFRYKGVALGSMVAEFAAPAMRGFYRLALRNSPGDAPLATDDLIVQQA